VQLKRLPEFIEARKRNWQILRRGLANLEGVLEFALPTHATGWDPEGDFSWDGSGCRSDPSWFGFLLRVMPQGPISRNDLARALDHQRIGTRMLFGGNLLRQPALVQLRQERPEAVGVVGDFKGSDSLMEQALFLGTYPGLMEGMLEAVVQEISEALRPSSSWRRFRSATSQP
jgi:CDP-6-deoxy-D-xylo-4-hexulose-3-dehydrase